MIKTDCINFPLDRPCRFHKDDGMHCLRCELYSPVISGSKKNKILMIKLGAMGDVLRTTFLIPGLKAKFKGAKITWIVAPESVGILEPNPGIDRVWQMDDRIFARLLSESFDHVINLDLSFESLSLATLAVSGDKIGFYLDSKRRIQCSNAYAKQWLEMSAFDDVKKRNDRTYQFWMSKITGLKKATYEIFTPLEKRSVEKAAEFSKKHDLAGRKVVGINPGAGRRWKLKKWTEPGYEQIIKRLISSGVKVLVLGGPEEKKLISSLVRKSGGKAISAGTENSIPDFFALLNLCDVLITGDTLALHAALGLKKKVLAIFGPTSSSEIEVYSRGIKVVSPSPCVCCYRQSCEVRPDCMEMIKPETVWSCLQKLMK